MTTRTPTTPRLGGLVYPMLALLGVLALWRGGLPGGDAAHARPLDAESDAAAIAVCAIPMLVNEIRETDRFLGAIEELEEEYDEQLEEVRAEQQEIREEFGDADQEDPRTREAIGRFRELLGEERRLLGERSRKIAELQAEQIVDAYALVRAAAKDIAEDLGYEYLIASGGEEEDLVSVDIDVTFRQMLARPCVLYPEDADITDEVRDDLNL